MIRERPFRSSMSAAMRVVAAWTRERCWRPRSSRRCPWSSSSARENPSIARSGARKSLGQGIAKGVEVGGHRSKAHLLLLELRVSLTCPRFGEGELERERSVALARTVDLVVLASKVRSHARNEERRRRRAGERVIAAGREAGDGEHLSSEAGAGTARTAITALGPGSSSRMVRRASGPSQSPRADRTRSLHRASRAPRRRSRRALPRGLRLSAFLRCWNPRSDDEDALARTLERRHEARCRLVVTRPLFAAARAAACSGMRVSLPIPPLQ